MPFVKKIVFIISAFSLTTFFAQDDTSTLFKNTKIANVQSTETLKKKYLECNAGLLFGKKHNDNIGTFNANFLNDVNLNCQYGFLSNLTIGIGISNVNSLINGTIKWKFLNQTASFHVPVSIAFYGCTGYTHKTTNNLYANVIKDFDTKEAHRINYLSQLIISSKINKFVYIEFLPSYTYRNFIKESVNINNGATDINGLFSLGFAGKVTLTQQLNITGNYFYNFADYYQDNQNAFNPLSLGFEINVGKNSFNLFVSNSSGLTENNFIPQTIGSWKDGNIKLGFTYSKTFSL